VNRLQRMPSGRLKSDDEQKKSDPQNPGEINCNLKIQGYFHGSGKSDQSLPLKTTLLFLSALTLLDSAKRLTFRHNLLPDVTLSQNLRCAER